MKHRYTAVLLAALLLLGATGCGSKTTTLTQSPVTETFAASTESTDIGEDPSEEASEDSTEAQEASSEDATEAAATTAAPAAAGSAPAQLGSDAPQQVTQAQTVDPSNIVEPPSGADDDQMGDLKVDTTTSPVPSNADKPAATAPAATEKPAASGNQLATKGGAASGKLQILVPTAEVTTAELKANDYTVDLLITLDKNPGITYSEWGLNLDKRCTYTADIEGLPINTVFSISDSAHFIWTAWTSGNTVTKKTGGMLRLHVKLPRDAKSGSTYPITYADQSLQPAPHIWQDDASNWVSSKEVGWTNGGVIVK